MEAITAEEKNYLWSRYGISLFFRRAASSLAQRYARISWDRKWLLLGTYWRKGCPSLLWYEELWWVHDIILIPGLLFDTLLLIVYISCYILHERSLNFLRLSYLILLLNLPQCLYEAILQCGYSGSFWFLNSSFYIFLCCRCTILRYFFPLTNYYIPR